MLKSIVRRNTVLLLIALSIFVVITLFITRQNTHKLTEQHLRRTHAMILQDITLEDLSNEALISKYAPQKSTLRITIIDSSGVVLIDSHSTNLDNHASRPEVLFLGSVFTRYSTTLDENMMYLAGEISQDVYLRVAIPVSSFSSTWIEVVTLSIVAGIVIFLLTYMFSLKLNQNVLTPFRAIETSLSEILDKTYLEELPYSSYPEMNEIIARINDINAQISKTLGSLTSEKDKLNLILNNMHQGVVLFDQHGKIKAINPFAQEFFEVDEQSVLEKDVIYLTRKIDFSDSIKRVFSENLSSHFEVSDHQQVFYVDLMALAEQNRVGVLMLIRDITPLRHLDQLKKEFFANASHELKSPLTSIKGAAELIELGFVKSDDEIKDLSKRIQKEANHMATLVEDMLYLSHVENPIDAEVKKEWNAVKGLINEVVESLGIDIELKHIHITVTGPNLLLYMNKQHLYQLLRNTIENACKYNVESGSVTIALSEKGKITVTDTGIGIAKEDQERIFERFYRVDKGRSKASGGTGLGLAIVKHIASYYDANIQLVSQMNKGTTLTFTFLPGMSKVKG